MTIFMTPKFYTQILRPDFYDTQSRNLGISNRIVAFANGLMIFMTPKIDNFHQFS